LLVRGDQSFEQTLLGGLPLDFLVAAAGFGLGFFGTKDRETAKLFYAAGLAGSCIYTYKFGRATSRMIDEKNTPPNKPYKLHP